ncbi:MAG TPA: ribosomal protein S18-alanine N-acetyltransferase [Syntrophomonadaceae bacterium]|nr:ribosomal protein S18-alanine N-acetyltransferase [Syntrophomonadaceae bacterium]
MMRKMTLQDLDQVMIIEAECFSLPWSRQSYENELKNQYASYRVVDFDGNVGAYGGIWVIFDEAHITNVAVAQKCRQNGWGKSLMLDLEKIAWGKGAVRIFLEVRPSNLAALNMYQGLGYVATGLRKEYYSDNQEDAVVMTKFL